jgi:hypothetical protein
MGRFKVGLFAQSFENNELVTIQFQNGNNGKMIRSGD